jgi:hypothetical protein
MIRIFKQQELVAAKWVDHLSSRNLGRKINPF